MAQTTLNLTTEAALEQYAKKVGTLLQELKKNRDMQTYTGSLEVDLEYLQKAIYRARIMKGCSVSVDIEFINRIELALIEYIEEE